MTKPENSSDRTAETLRAKDAVSALDPTFAERAAKWAALPWRSDAIEEKVLHLIAFGLDIAVTHPNREAASAHARRAADAGASTAELTDVCELVALLGSHSVMMGGPILDEELRAAGVEVPQVDEAGEAIRAKYIADRGIFPAPLEAVLALDPEWVDAYRSMSGRPFVREGLSPVSRELVLIALDAATTHLHAVGTRAHIRMALRLGATGRQILETLELASVLGLEGSTLGAEIVQDLLAPSSPNH